MNTLHDDTNMQPWLPTDEATEAQPTGVSMHILATAGPMIKQPHTAPWSGEGMYNKQQLLRQPPWSQYIGAYRENIILSDDGTAPESALGDNHFQYMDDIASFSGTGNEAVGAAQVEQMLDGIQISNLGPHMPSMRDNAMDSMSNYSAATATTAATAATGLPGALQCPKCNKACKSQSGLKKHEMTHSRPYVCSYPNCNKSKEGFSTPNDLNRHKASVHKEATIRYRCPFSECENSIPDPRKDNFRNHLDRVHKVKITSEEADARYRIEYHMSSEILAPPTDTATVEDDASSEMEMELSGANNHVVETSSMMDASQAQYDSQNTTSTLLTDMSLYSTYSADSQLALQPPSFSIAEVQTDVSLGAESAQSMQRHQPSPNFGNQSFTKHSAAPVARDIFAQPMVHNSGYPATTQHGWPPSQDAGRINEASIRSPQTSSVLSAAPRSYNIATLRATDQATEVLCHDNLVRDGWTQTQIVAHLSTFPIELLEQALKSKPHSSCTSNEPEESPVSKTGYQCSQCDKVCIRACELKKHMKRHERPYACTSKDCGKSFGSKNDWKRHEGSQHDDAEAWACNQDGCVAVFEDRLSFRQHLNEVHDMEYDDDVQGKLQSCRIGRQCDSRFWCGFCRRVVEIDDTMIQEDGGSGTNGSRRFDHIDSHLFGKGGLRPMHKSQWWFLEDEARGNAHRRADQMSATASVRSTTTSNGAAYKRKGSEHVDSRPRKRADGQWAGVRKVTDG